MREIKFRAWNGKEMFNVDVLAISACTWDCPDHGKRGVSLAYQPHITVMQYTGLKDKNGVEIYERDFVEEEGQISVCAWIREVAAYAFVPVEMYPQEDWQTLYETYSTDSFFRNDVPCQFVKVIGNIHKNPEILEGK